MARVGTTPGEGDRLKAEVLPTARATPRTPKAESVTR
jgi:hypothetical protein